MQYFNSTLHINSDVPCTLYNVHQPLLHPSSSMYRTEHKKIIHSVLLLCTIFLSEGNTGVTLLFLPEGNAMLVPGVTLLFLPEGYTVLVPGPSIPT